MRHSASKNKPATYDRVGGLTTPSGGSAQGLRGFLVSAWVPLNRHASELAAPFLELEKLSRGPSGTAASLRSADSQELSRERYDERVSKALDGGEVDDMTIHSAIGREDFATARKLIGRLPEGERKKRFSETVDTREAISLAAKGDITGAEALTRRLNKAVWILQVYPAIIDKCVANKDSSCATSLTHQAVKQLGRAEDRAAVPLTLSRLATSVARASDSLALEVLEEAVAAANRAGDDLATGETGLDTAVFRQLAPKNEDRARQAAEGLKKPLAQIVSLAAIYQWKAEALSKS